MIRETKEEEVSMLGIRFDMKVWHRVCVRWDGWMGSVFIQIFTSGKLLPAVIGGRTASLSAAGIEAPPVLQPIPL